MSSISPIGTQSQVFNDNTSYLPQKKRWLAKNDTAKSWMAQIDTVIAQPTQNVEPPTHSSLVNSQHKIFIHSDYMNLTTTTVATTAIASQSPVFPSTKIHKFLPWLPQVKNFIRWDWDKWKTFVFKLRSEYFLSWNDTAAISGIPVRSLCERFCRENGKDLKRFTGKKLDELPIDLQTKIIEEAERIKAQISFPTTSTTTTTTSSYDSDAEDSETNYQDKYFSC